MRKALVKGSKEAKAFMAKIRAKKASATKSIKNVATNVKRVAKGAKNAFREGYYAKDKVGAVTSYAVIQYFKKYNDKFIIDVVPIKKYNLRKNTDYRDTRLLNILDTKTDANKEAERYYKFVNQIGSTLLIEKGENPRKKPTRVIQVDRTKKGLFKKFSKVSGVNHKDTKSHNVNIRVVSGVDIKTTKGKQNLKNVKLFISIVSSLGNLKTEGTKRSLNKWVENSIKAEELLNRINKSILPQLYLSNLNDAISTFNYWKV